MYCIGSGGFYAPTTLICYKETNYKYHEQEREICYHY